MNENRGWNAFKYVCTNCLGSKKSNYYEDLVDELIQSYKTLDYNKSLKLHLDFFLENLDAVSDEHCGTFHHELLKWRSHIVENITGYRTTAGPSTVDIDSAE